MYSGVVVGGISRIGWPMNWSATRLRNMMDGTTAASLAWTVSYVCQIMKPLWLWITYIFDVSKLLFEIVKVRGPLSTKELQVWIKL